MDQRLNYAARSNTNILHQKSGARNPHPRSGTISQETSDGKIVRLAASLLSRSGELDGLRGGASVNSERLWRARTSSGRRVHDGDGRRARRLNVCGRYGCSQLYVADVCRSQFLSIPLDNGN